MKYEPKVAEIEAVQFLGPDEDPDWHQQILMVFPGLGDSVTIHRCRIRECEHAGWLKLPPAFTADYAAPTDWIVRYKTPAKVNVFEVIPDKIFRHLYQPSDRHQITGQRMLAMEVGNA